MIKKIIGTAVLATLICSVVFAQQNVNFRQANIVSPLVNEEGTVTFRLRAPLAQTVTVRGDWEANGGKGQMTKDTGGTWVYTTGKLPSDLYLYSFVVDSVRILDPSNAFSYRDVGNLFSVFIINHGNGDYYSVGDVPHGNVEKVWYPSCRLRQNIDCVFVTDKQHKGNSGNHSQKCRGTLVALELAKAYPENYRATVFTAFKNKN